MKWLFGFLLMLSITFFALMQWGGALTGSNKNSQSLGALNAEKIKLLELPAPRQMPGSAVLPLQSAVAISAPAAVSSAVAASGVVAVLAPSSAVPAAVPAAAPLPASVPVAAPVMVRGVKAVAVKNCMEWGEFSGTDLKLATKALAAMKLGDRLAQRTVEYASGYWVYIPPLANKTAVNKKIREIKAAGVEDYFVVQDSRKWFNAISLGVFKTREAAKHFQASLKDKGLRSTRVGERKHKLKFTVFVLKHIGAEERTRLSVLQKDLPNSELKAIPCHN